jgi:hypothetical protein
LDEVKRARPPLGRLSSEESDSRMRLNRREVATKAAFTRRLEALEKTLIAAQKCEGSARDREFSRVLLERLAAGMRRVAEARERGGLAPSVEVEPYDVKTEGRTIVEILHAGRERSAMARQALGEAARPSH